MRKTALKFLGVVAAICALSGCNTPHLVNPVHLYKHAEKIFSPAEEGELHSLHVDIDRVIFGLTWYEEFETADPIYSR